MINRKLFSQAEIDALLQNARREGYQDGRKDGRDNDSPVPETKSFVLDDSEKNSECCTGMAAIFAVSAVCGAAVGAGFLLRLMLDDSGAYARSFPTNNPMEIPLAMGSFAGSVVFAGGLLVWGVSSCLNKKSDKPEEEAQNQHISSSRKK